MYKARLKALTADAFAKMGAAVQSGPFAGMTLVQETSWYGGDLLTKLLGIYEMELHGPISEAISYNPTVVINVGCAEGYYAVGLSLCLPQATVHVFDIDLEALQVCEKAAAANRVDGKLRLEKGCSGTAVNRLVQSSKRCVLFVDCEGCEHGLLLELSPNEMVRTIFIVETHETVVPGVTDDLMNRFKDTHHIRSITQGARNPHEIEMLSGLPEDMQWLAVSEGRPQTSKWLFGVPLAIE